jgi:ATP-binding cassette, subfamily B, bacterial
MANHHFAGPEKKPKGPRKEVQFFAAAWKANPRWAAFYWVLLVVRGVLPALVSVCFGWLIGAITTKSSATAPLIALGVTFTGSLILQPIHTMVSQRLGGLLASHLYQRLLHAGVTPPGIAHLERPELTGDLTMARDFDLGMMGPPLDISMDFLTSGLLDLVIGAVAAVLLFGFAWWAPLVLATAWISTHILLKESGVWKDRNTDTVRNAQRHAEYAYRLAVDAAPSKEVRYFGLAGWVTDRFVNTRRQLYELQYEATKLRERSVLKCLVIVAAANGLVFWALAQAVRNGDLSTGRVVIFVQAALGTASIAFGGLNWALDTASSPVAALIRVESAMAMIGALTTAAASLSTAPVAGSDKGPTIVFDNVTFAYEQESGRKILKGLNLEIPGGTSMAIVGINGAGKTTLAKVLCRLYDPSDGQIQIDGKPLTAIQPNAWRNRVTAVFQDFVRFELPLRTNVAPQGARDADIHAALVDAGAEHLADGNLDTVLSKGYPGGTDLSGGQWQRIALARTLCAVRQGASVVLLDEPTAQLDVRGEAEIFERLLTKTKGCTIILISHRFSTVRLADRICVLEHGEVVELGSHDELMARGGRYRTMFELQASRFTEHDEAGAEIVHEQL